MLETELKRMLTEDEYEMIKKMFAWDEIAEQVNRYYSDPGLLLKQNGITLRVRTRGGVSKIQVKVHKNADSPLQICEETEREISEIPDRFSAEEVKELTGLETDAVFIGSLTTERSSCFTENAEICLDKNTYLGCTDYELEIEYSGDMPKALKKRLSDAGIDFTEPAVGKMTRFMQLRRALELLPE